MRKLSYKVFNGKEIIYTTDYTEILRNNWHVLDTVFVEVDERPENVKQKMKARAKLREKQADSKS